MVERRSGNITPALPGTVSPADTRICMVRGVAVMLDSDLADVYGVTTKNLNKAVDRNPERFAEPFSFRVTTGEWEILRFQIGTSSSWGGRRYLPRVFTEHGAVMLAAVLNSDRAIAASRAVVDAFVRIRRALDFNQALARRLDELAVETASNKKAIAVIFKELRQLATGLPEPEPEKPKGRIGFRTNKEREAEGGGQRGRAKRKT